MLYRDLIEFEPLESVIQLRDADSLDGARSLVRNYVISGRMADQLVNLVIPNLRIDRAVDNKGVLVVGNYGTGKSHLMSMLSAVAEHPALAGEVRHPGVRAAMAPIAGRFQVVRAELGAVRRSLRDSIVYELEQFLQRRGVDYRFPADDQITSNKPALVEAVEHFRRRYPESGVLFVLDELLDFLRSRDDRALILDLGFLRELGEVVELAPFRFVAGVQETLFDNPRFAFVAEQLRRVRDRFEQVRIAREDIAFVVAERLLKKNDAQLARIAEHLRTFAPLYPPLGEQLDRFTRLFPIHPAYIDTFEQVYIAEKREVLKTFSHAIRQLLDQELPPAQPGLVAYDHYWQLIKENPSLRSLPGVSEVVDKSNVLMGRIENAYTRRNLLPLARRIIAALSVLRLTTSDLNAPLGATAEELRDNLTLWAPMPEADAGFLADTVGVALQEIVRTVSGQYISYNEENGQYYLDLTKVVDFDANIAQRGDFLDENELNRYFYDAFQRLLPDLPSSVQITGYHIWRYELPWHDRQVTRPGYLFFGLPNERSTAQPPRDFYVYILPPFGVHDWNRPGAAPAPTGADEVLFQLTGLGADFEEIVRKYAGARAMALQSPAYAQTYEDKAEEHRRRLQRWLQQNMVGRLKVIHQGALRGVSELLAATRSSASGDVEALLRLLAAHLLAPTFEDAYPDYPAFPVREPLGEAARPTAAGDAMRTLLGRGRTQLGASVLLGLGLADTEGTLRPLASPYARHLLELLQARPELQVVNYGEVMETVAPGSPPIVLERRFRLEPEWVAVLLTALVYDGQIVLNLGGNDELDAGSAEQALVRGLPALADFRFYKRPRSLPLAVWQQIFDGLGLQSSLLRDERERERAVRELLAKVQAEQSEVATLLARVQGGLQLWNEAVFTDRLEFIAREGMVETAEVEPVRLGQLDLLPGLRATREFLETLARYNTPGKLRNLALNAADVQQALADRGTVDRVRALVEAVDRLQAATAYLGEARAGLPEDHPWVAAATTARAGLLAALRRLGRGEGELRVHDWTRRLADLKRQYVDVYAGLHYAFVLGPADDDRRARLHQDTRVQQFKTLAQADVFRNGGEWESWSAALAGIKECREFHAGLLETTPICPRCSYRPNQTAGQQPAAARLQMLEQRLETLLGQWHTGLRQTLESESVRASIGAMAPAERRPLEAYLAAVDPLAAPLPAGLATAANQALRGLTTVTIDPAALLEALRQGGLPATPEQIKERIGHYLAGLLHGHDIRTTRFTVQQG